jgi:hypothetical protein
MHPVARYKSGYQEVLGETPEAVKPCLEGSMREIEEERALYFYFLGGSCGRMLA